MKLNIYNVGQGDAILLTWQDEGIDKIGIIDCNKFEGQNKILHYLTTNSINQIEFIVLTHFHYDHFSGFADIFEYCINRNVKIKFFLHTFASHVLNIYDQIFYSKRVENEIERFILNFDDLTIENEVLVNCFTKDISLSEEISMSFLAPQGNVYTEIAKKIHRKNAGITCTYADINRLSTIIKFTKGSDCILLTADADKKSFSKIRNKISDKLLLSQIPHHGSSYNIDSPFWSSLNFEKDCPIFVSVGDKPEDKLPHKATIQYFDNLGFKIFSTNNVYGISEYFGSGHIPKANNSLNLFSKRISSVSLNTEINDQFNGDKDFKVFL